MTDTNGKHPHGLIQLTLTWKQLLGAGVPFIAAVLGIAFYLDGQFDDLRAQMINEFETTRSDMTTANDDLNYRLGFHRGVTTSGAIELMLPEDRARLEQLRDKSPLEGSAEPH